MRVTVRNYRGRLCAWVGPGYGFVIHSLAELVADGFEHIPGTRGVWVQP